MLIGAFDPGDASDAAADRLVNHQRLAQLNRAAAKLHVLGVRPRVDEHHVQVNGAWVVSRGLAKDEAGDDPNRTSRSRSEGAAYPACVSSWISA